MVWPVSTMSSTTQTDDFLDSTCGTHSRIALEAYESNLCVNAFCRAEKVAGKRKRPVQHTDEQGRFIGVVAHYLPNSLIRASMDSLEM